MAIWYPEQSFSNPVPYTTTISQFTNITFDGNLKYGVFTEGELGRMTLSGYHVKNWAKDGFALYAKAGVIEVVKSQFFPKFSGLK